MTAISSAALDLRVAAHAQCGEAWAIATLPFARHGRPESLTGGDSLEAIFTPAERRLARRHLTLDSWAGRLAAKHAIRAVIAQCIEATIALGDIEVLPRMDGGCTTPYRCAQGHPLRVHLRDRYQELGDSVSVSISHEHTFAVAIASLRLLSAPG